MKLDEMSVTSMINGFLANQKIEAVKSKKDNLKKRNKEFFKLFKESLNEAAPKDWDKASEPDDWRQTFEAPVSGGGKLKPEDVGAFASTDEKEPETVRTSSSEPQQRNKAEISEKELGRMVQNAMELMKSRNPEEYKKFEALTDDQKKVYRIKLGQKIREKGSLAVEKGSNIGGGGGSGAVRRREVASRLAKNLLDRLSTYSLDPKMIDPKVADFSKRFLGMDPTNEKVAVYILNKYEQANDEQKAKIASAIAEKALSTPESSANLVKFMNSRLDMYPHEWMDQTEETANIQGIPSAKEDSKQGLGFGIKRIGDAPESATTKRQHKTRASQKRAEDFSQKLKDLGREDLQGKVIGRKHIGDSAVYRLFGNAPLEDIMRYADYFTQNPEEINRAKEERRNPPPSDLTDLMGKVPNIGDEGEFKKAEIGAEHEGSSIVSPGDLSAAKKDYASKLAKFKGGQENIAKAEKEAGGQKSKYVFPAGMQYEKPFDLNYKEIFKNLTDVGTLDQPKQKIPGLTNRLIRDLSNRMNIAARKRGEDQASPEVIMDILRKLAKYDSKGRYQGLSSSPEDLQNLAPEEGWIAKELVRVFNPQRMMKTKDVSKAGMDLPRAFSDYASSELEKVVSNIPARDAAIKQEEEKQKREEEAKARSLDVEKKSAMRPDQIAAKDEERVARRKQMIDAIKARIASLPADIKSAISSREEALGNSKEWEQLKKDMQTLSAEVPYSKEAADLYDQLSSLFEYERSRRDPKVMAKASKLKKTPKDEKMKLSKALPHAIKAKELGDINPKSAYVPSELGKTKQSPGGGIDISKKKVELPPSPREEHFGKMSSGVKTRERKPDEIEDISRRTGKPSSEIDKTVPDFINRGVQSGQMDFKYAKESPVQFKRKLLQNLINDARKKVASMGGAVDARTMMQYIIHNFETGKYPKAYDQIKDVVLAKGPVFMRSSELKQESKQMKKMSLVELLCNIDKNVKDLEHVDVDEEEWDKADPEKKMNLVPKFSKQKKMGKK